MNEQVKQLFEALNHHGVKARTAEETIEAVQAQWSTVVRHAQIDVIVPTCVLTAVCQNNAACAKMLLSSDSRQLLSRIGEEAQNNWNTAITTNQLSLNLVHDIYNSHAGIF